MRTILCHFIHLSAAKLRHLIYYLIYYTLIFKKIKSLQKNTALHVKKILPKTSIYAIMNAYYHLYMEVLPSYA